MILVFFINLKEIMHIIMRAWFSLAWFMTIYSQLSTQLGQKTKTCPNLVLKALEIEAPYLFLKQFNKF